MLIPILAADAAGVPLVTGRISGDEAASCDAFEVVRRLGVASPLILLYPQATLAQKPTELAVKAFEETDVVAGPFPIEQAELSRPWLEAGAKYGLFTISAMPAMPLDLAASIKAAAAAVAVPAERMLLALDVPALAQTADVQRLATFIDALAAPAGVGCYEFCKPESVGAVSGVVLAIPPGTSPTREEELLQLLAPIATRDRLQVFLGGLSSSTNAATTGHLHHMNLHSLGVAALGPSSGEHAVRLPPPPQLPPPAASLASLFAAPVPLDFGACLAACVRTDRSDGLFPTLVLEADGAALGLVYSSAASIAAAVRCGRGVYWSRSRQSLWRKGDTSGAWQTLRKVRLDCDADALCFTVTQHGVPPAFCHKACLSCWGPSMDKGFQGLQQTLQQRKVNAPPGSYTKRLFDDPVLLRNKLVEEAQELAEAEEPDHVAAECADVMYFAMVRCVAAGVTLVDVQRHLDKRSLKLNRRPGNDKKERIEAAAKILAEKGGGGGGGKKEGGGGGGASSFRKLLPVMAAAGAAAAMLALKPK